MSRRWLTLALSLALAPACGDDGALEADAYLDAGPPTDGLTGDGGIPLNLPAGGTGHSKVGTTLAAGQVRAGRVTTSSQLLSGIKVEGKVGDYKLYNSKVAFIIAGVRTTDGLVPVGGELLDAMRLGQVAGQGDSLWGESMLGAGIQVLDPVSVGVVQDGSDGKTALVRVIGKPLLIPYLAALLGESFGGDLEAHIVIDYVLQPDSEVLEIRWRFFNKTTSELEMPALIIGLGAGDGAELFAEGQGFAPDKIVKQDYVGMVGRYISYALVCLEKPLTPLVQYSGIWILSNDTLKLPAASQAQRTLYLAVTGGEPEALRRAVRKLKKVSEPATVSGKVLSAAKTAVAAARVHVQKDDTDKTYVTMTRTDASGAYSLALEPGKYLLSVTADGRALQSAVSLTVGSAASSQDLTAGGSGTLVYSVKDDKSGSLPAQLVFVPKVSTSSPPKAFGEPSFAFGATSIVFSTSGSGQVALPDGEYTATASRGFEYEKDKQTVTLSDGGSQSVAFTLKRVVDTTGYMCGDFHFHATRSPDSSDLNELKVAALAAAGLEIPVITDHEYISDLNPAIAKLGLQKWIYSIIGEEVTTLVYGHFNPFPVTQDKSKPNMGAVSWFKKSPATMFADVRKAWPSAVMQVNHPNAPSIGGFFSTAGYDSVTGKVKNPSMWSKDFDAVEVFNGDSFSANYDGTVKDWFSFLQRGLLVTATGNSDNHSAYRSSVGYPRSYVRLSVDEPAKLSLVELAKAVKEQRVVVSGGPFITASVGGKSMGEVASATGQKADLAVKVQAPSWIKVDTLLVFMGAVQTHKVTLDSSTADPTNPVIRYNATLELLPTKDSWVVVAVTGTGSLSPVSSGTPFAMTNPIYLDVNGNGSYDAPMSF